MIITNYFIIINKFKLQGQIETLIQDYTTEKEDTCCAHVNRANPEIDSTNMLMAE